MPKRMAGDKVKRGAQKYEVTGGRGKNVGNRFSGKDVKAMRQQGFNEKQIQRRADKHAADGGRVGNFAQRKMDNGMRRFQQENSQTQDPRATELQPGTGEQVDLRGADGSGNADKGNGSNRQKPNIGRTDQDRFHGGGGRGRDDGKVYAGGSKHFDESTGQYTDGRSHPKPGDGTSVPGVKPPKNPAQDYKNDYTTQVHNQITGPKNSYNTDDSYNTTMEGHKNSYNTNDSYNTDDSYNSNYDFNMDNRTDNSNSGNTTDSYNTRNENMHNTKDSYNQNDSYNTENSYNTDNRNSGNTSVDTNSQFSNNSNNTTHQTDNSESWVNSGNETNTNVEDSWNTNANQSNNTNVTGDFNNVNNSQVVYGNNLDGKMDNHMMGQAYMDQMRNTTNKNSGFGMRHAAGAIEYAKGNKAINVGALNDQIGKTSQYFGDKGTVANANVYGDPGAWNTPTWQFQNERDNPADDYNSGEDDDE